MFADVSGKGRKKGTMRVGQGSKTGTGGSEHGASKGKGQGTA
jgi:hypothetical protein